MTNEGTQFGKLEDHNIWIADSGSTSHMTGCKEILTDYISFWTPKKILTAGSDQHAHGIGSVLGVVSIRGGGILCQPIVHRAP